MGKRILFLLIDGIGDVTIPQVSDRTPLEIAHTPVLDAIAAAGLNGLMDSVEPGLACGSDTAHMSILGYEPRRHYRGRGAFESMGAGIHMAPGDIAFKCNFATIDEQTGIVLRRRADRHFEHLGPTLCAALDGLPLPNFPGLRVSVRYATEHRCGVAISGPGLTDAVGSTDPLKDNLALLQAEALDDSEEARFTAAAVNELSTEVRRVLRDHPINKERVDAGLPPANVVLLRGCGSRIRVASFQTMHGMRGCIVAPTKIIAGLGMSFDMDVIEVAGATGSYDTDFSAKAAGICEALMREHEPYDFGFVHVKAVDDTGHDRMMGNKVRFLEAVDVMLGQIVRRLWESETATPASPGFTLVVTGDHSTPVMFGDHSYEPVPFAIAHLWHVVESLGENVVRSLPLTRVPAPNVKGTPPSEQELARQVTHQDARHRAAAAGRGWQAGLPAEVFGPHSLPWPQLVRGDRVAAYDELSAAHGGLGRFLGAGVMQLVKEFSGRILCTAT